MRRVSDTNENLKEIRVLIVDDNAVNRMILAHALSAAGMTPAEAESGDIALEVLMKARDGGSAYRLALVDYAMPGMDGFQLAEKINNERGLSIPTITMLVSGGQRGDAMRCK